MGRRSFISRDAGLQEAGEGVGVGVGEEGRGGTLITKILFRVFLWVVSKKERVK